MQFKRGCRKMALDLSLDRWPPGQRERVLAAKRAEVVASSGDGWLLVHWGGWHTLPWTGEPTGSALCAELAQGPC
jgi:hypothetical protein